MIRRAALLAPALALALSFDRRPAQAPPAQFSPDDVARAMRALPARDEGRFGRPGDPLNLVFFGDAAAIEAALEAAGWSRVPGSTAQSLAEGLEDLWLARPLARFPPMNSYRTMGRFQDMNWARPIRAIESRHHFRLWRTGIVDGRGRELWWGSGNLDLFVRWSDLSHTPDPDMDAERDFIAASLKGKASLAWQALPQIPLEGVNDKGYAFRTDGRVLIVGL